MRKVFITNISLQSKSALLKQLYQPVGFELKKNRETCFPIIPMIAENQEEGDEIAVLAIRSDNRDTPDNYALFCRELSELGIQEKQITEISTVENQSDSVNLKLLLKIMDEIPKESMVYGDITFGTKPMAAVLLYVLNFIEKMKDCEVAGIYYGEIRREKGETKGAALYDLKIFKLLGDVIDQMRYLGIDDMKTALERILRV